MAFCDGLVFHQAIFFCNEMSNGRVLIDTIRSEFDSNAGLKLSAKADGFLLRLKIFNFYFERIIKETSTVRDSNNYERKSKP